MNILISKGWDDYQLLDSGNGFRLEKFGKYTIVRPDPQAIWKPILSEKDWEKAAVSFKRTKADSGIWEYKTRLPEKWKMTYKDLSFWARLTSFKHTGVFPEQSLQWDFIQEKIQERKTSYSSSEAEASTESRSQFSTSSNNNSQPSILNLFGYTGIASLAAAAAGAKVTHVDASKPSITWARDNQKLSGLEEKPIRWILEDAVKFVEREHRRGNTYDGIIMDPPVYGHGPTGQIWKFNDNFPKLMEDVSKILSPKPLFVIVNAYAISSSALMLRNVLNDYLPNGTTEVGELCLEERAGKRLLSTGIYARWYK